MDMKMPHSLTGHLSIIYPDVEAIDPRLGMYFTRNLPDKIKEGRPFF